MAAIKTIRDMRNKVVGHGAETKITNNDFAYIWGHVTLAFRQLSRMLNPDDQCEYFTMESNIMLRPFQQDIFKQLDEIEVTDAFTQAVVNSILPKVIEKIRIESEADYRRRNEEIFRRLEKIEKRQAEQGKQQHTNEQKIALLARMQVNTGSARSSRQVQEHILQASKDIISNGPDVDNSNDDVLSAVRNLFEGMEEQRVKVVRADKGSILLTVLCPTIRSIRDVLLYLKSPQIQPKLSCIEKAVDVYHGCETKITIGVDLNSLETAINELEKDLDVDVLYLTLECKGIGGVRNAFQMFENGKSSNTLNKLSEALSNKVGEKVELQAGIDIDKLEDDIEKEKNVEDYQLKKKEYILNEKETKHNLGAQKHKSEDRKSTEDVDKRIGGVISRVYKETDERQHSQDEKRKNVGKRETEEKQQREERRKREEKRNIQEARRRRREEEERKQQEEERRKKVEAKRQGEEEKPKGEEEKNQQYEERRMLEENDGSLMVMYGLSMAAAGAWMGAKAGPVGAFVGGTFGLLATAALRIKRPAEKQKEEERQKREADERRTKIEKDNRNERLPASALATGDGRKAAANRLRVRRRTTLSSKSKFSGGEEKAESSSLNEN